MHWLLPGCRADSALVDLDGDGMADYEQPPSALLYYAKGVSSWLFSWVISQLVFASAYMAAEPWNFWEALYLCIVTATTVGYGDISVSDKIGNKLFASFHILYSVSSLAALINTVQVLYSERMIQRRKCTLLNRQLDVELIESLDKDNNGLDKLEFVVGMLTKLEILHWDDVEPFLAQFDALDKDGSGRLDKQDLRQMVEERQRKVEEHRAAKHAAKIARSGTSLMVVAGAPEGATEEALATVANGSGADVVRRFADVEDGCGAGRSNDSSAGAGPCKSGAHATPPSSMSQMYGGVAAHDSELRRAGYATEEGALVDGAHPRKGGRGLLRMVPSGLPAQVLTGGGRVRDSRRPRHLRGKVTPDG